MPHYRVLIDKIAKSTTDASHSHFATQVVAAWWQYAPPENVQLARLEGVPSPVVMDPAPASGT